MAEIVVLNCNRFGPSEKELSQKLIAIKMVAKAYSNIFSSISFLLLLLLHLFHFHFCMCVFFSSSLFHSSKLLRQQPHCNHVNLADMCCNAAPSVEICFSNFLTCLPFPRLSSHSLVLSCFFCLFSILRVLSVWMGRHLVDLFSILLKRRLYLNIHPSA